MKLEPLYLITAKCDYCETSFHTSRVRHSLKKAHFTDTDFYMRYKGVNPDYYVVTVCPNCGYAFTENFSKGLAPVIRTSFELKVVKNWTGHDYGGERNWDDALHTYQLALLSAQIKNEKDRVVAGLLHHIAWLYRDAGNKKQEERFLEHALDSYVRVYELEGISVDNARLMYLMGELNRRLGRYNEAVRWFSRVINDKNIIDAAMIRASRDQWKVTREDMLAAQIELPEEMKNEAKKHG
ncbi:DUF2225 domain-containing protein [Gorillibacterium massiliense]|uniref:DUF2225 domain-containing protein n=1 Tax=Gorillibacterium massiliense TaxID=1280390 RepID=UPI00192E323D|nr:DUF2225 domain-containing protein [Gorillibacterium massiliense]